MLVKEVLSLAAVNLCDDEIYSNLNGSANITDKNTLLLLKCLNFTVEDIATNYIPLIDEETINTDNGEIQFIGLKKPIIDVLSIADKYGKEIKYKLFPDRIKTNEEIVKITYSFLPNELNFDDEIKLPKVTPRILSYGVCMEYSFLQSLSDEASIWEKRFKDGLMQITRKKSELRLPKRRWL